MIRLDNTYDPRARLVDEGPANLVYDPARHGRDHLVVTGAPGELEQNGPTIRYFWRPIDESTVMVSPTLDAAMLQPGEELEAISAERRRVTLTNGARGILSKLTLQARASKITIMLMRRQPIEG